MALPIMRQPSSQQIKTYFGKKYLYCFRHVAISCVGSSRRKQQTKLNPPCIQHLANHPKDQTTLNPPKVLKAFKPLTIGLLITFAKPPQREAITKSKIMRGSK